MKSKTTLLLLLLCLTSCSGEDDSTHENFLQDQTYVHLFFQSEKECIDGQPEPDFFYNCHQQVNFLQNNTVEIILTDIIWRGRYEIKMNTIILYFEPNFEIPDGEIKFEILHSTKLLNLDHSTVWKKVNGDSIWD